MFHVPDEMRDDDVEIRLLDDGRREGMLTWQPTRIRVVYTEHSPNECTDEELRQLTVDWAKKNIAEGVAGRFKRDDPENRKKWLNGVMLSIVTSAHEGETKDEEEEMRAEDVQLKELADGSIETTISWQPVRSVVKMTFSGADYTAEKAVRTTLDAAAAYIESGRPGRFKRDGPPSTEESTSPALPS